MSGKYHVAVILTQRKEPPGTHRIGGWEGSTTSLVIVEKRYISCPHREIMILQTIC